MVGGGGSDQVAMVTSEHLVRVACQNGTLGRLIMDIYAQPFEALPLHQIDKSDIPLNVHTWPVSSLGKLFKQASEVRAHDTPQLPRRNPIC